VSNFEQNQVFVCVYVYVSLCEYVYMFPTYTIYSAENAQTFNISKKLSNYQKERKNIHLLLYALYTILG